MSRSYNIWKQSTWAERGELSNKIDPYVKLDWLRGVEVLWAWLTLAVLAEIASQKTKSLN